MASLRFQATTGAGAGCALCVQAGQVGALQLCPAAAPRAPFTAGQGEQGRAGQGARAHTGRAGSCAQPTGRTLSGLCAARAPIPLGGPDGVHGAGQGGMTAAGPSRALALMCMHGRACACVGWCAGAGPSVRAGFARPAAAGRGHLRSKRGGVRQPGAAAAAAVAGAPQLRGERALWARPAACQKAWNVERPLCGSPC